MSKFILVLGHDAKRMRAHAKKLLLNKGWLCCPFPEKERSEHQQGELIDALLKDRSNRVILTFSEAVFTRFLLRFTEGVIQEGDAHLHYIPGVVQGQKPPVVSESPFSRKCGFLVTEQFFGQVLADRRAILQARREAGLR